jgi:hypothetical protein
MAIPTSTAQLAVMEWGQVWEPGLPLSPVAITTEAQQQLVWEYPWGTDIISHRLQATAAGFICLGGVVIVND